MKVKKLLISILTLSFLIGGISNVNAYYSAKDSKNSNCVIKDINISNIFTSNIKSNLVSIHTANGSTSVVGNDLKLTWHGSYSPSLKCVYFESYLFKPWSTTKNKDIVNKIGMEIEPNKKYKISYDINGDKLDYSELLVFYANEQYEGLYVDADIDKFYIKRNVTSNHVEAIITTPSNQKYMSIRIDPYFNNPVSGDSVIISNLKVQKIMN